MPIADQYARVLQILGAQEALGESRRKRQAEQSIGDIFAKSGGKIDMGTIQQAFQADPGTAMKLLEFAQGQQTASTKLETEKLRQLNLGQQIQGRSKEELARYAYPYLQGFDKLPPEQRTPEMWRKGYLPARQKGIQMGFSPELLPEDAGPDELRSIIGLGFPVAQQAQQAYREQESATRQKQFDQTYAQRQSIANQRLGQQASIAAQNRSASMERTKLIAGSLGGGMNKEMTGDALEQNKMIEDIIPVVDDSIGRIEDTVGVVPRAKEIGSAIEGTYRQVTGQPAKQSFPEVTEARRVAGMLRQRQLELISSMKGRFAVAEQQRLLPMTVNIEGWVTNPADEKARLQAFKDEITRMHESNRKRLEGKASAPLSSSGSAVGDDALTPEEEQELQLRLQMRGK